MSATMPATDMRSIAIGIAFALLGALLLWLGQRIFIADPHPIAAGPPSASATFASTTAMTHSPRITTHVDTVTVHVTRQPLREVLRNIESQSNTHFVVDAQVERDLISADVQAMPLLSGLRALLHDYDVLLFAAARTDVMSKHTIWIYPRGTGAAIAQHALTGAASSGNGNEMSDARIARADAAETPSMEGLTNEEASTPETLTLELHDPSADVRRRALGHSLQHNVQLPPALLQQVVYSDTDRDVRDLALTAVAQSESDATFIAAVARAALSDSDEQISTHAQGILDYLDIAALPNE